jgi:hypothetical protein
MAGTPVFNRFLKDVRQGNLIKPVIAAALSDPTFQKFDIPVDGWEERPYDGFFHPSTHATWTVRQLYYYLVDPGSLYQERPNLLFVLSVTQGKFWHKFIQRILLENGILIKDEVPILDEVYNRKGHADGELNNGEIFEFKTASERVIARMKTAEDLQRENPKYYAQTQDYLDVMGRDYMRYFIMQLSAPFAMEEFVVPADKEFQQKQRDKYEEALSAAKYQWTPDACCSINSPTAKGCVCKLACPVGRATAL